MPWKVVVKLLRSMRNLLKLLFRYAMNIIALLFCFLLLAVLFGYNLLAICLLIFLLLCCVMGQVRDYSKITVVYLALVVIFYREERLSS